MEASSADISRTALFNNDGRGFNSEIRMRDVITNYIYPNTLAVLKVSGADLKAALEAMWRRISSLKTDKRSSI